MKTIRFESEERAKLAVSQCSVDTAAYMESFGEEKYKPQCAVRVLEVLRFKT